MGFWIWLIIAFCFIVYVTMLFIKALKKGSQLVKVLKIGL